MNSQTTNRRQTGKQKVEIKEWCSSEADNKHNITTRIGSYTHLCPHFDYYLITSHCSDQRSTEDNKYAEFSIKYYIF